MSPSGNFAKLLDLHIIQSKVEPVICVEGNIAAGKTNLMTKLKPKIEDLYGKNCVNLVPEPVKEWNDVGGEKLFDMMMQEPKRWSFAFQNYVQLSMFNAHCRSLATNTQESKLHLVERSIHSARYVFVENHRKLGNMQQVEYNVLDEFYRMITRELEYKLSKVDYFLFLEADIEVCLERLANRLRTQDATMTQEESRVTLDYLRSLGELYETHMLSREEFRDKVIRIDANLTTEEIIRNLGF